MNARAATWVFVVMGLGCAEPDPVRTCAPLSTPDRYALGEPAPYPNDATLRERESELFGSTVQRRFLGWRVAADVLGPVEVDVVGVRRQVPRFQTWMDRTELRRVAAGLNDAPSSTEIDAALADNQLAVLEAEAWPAERLADYLDGLSETERLNGTGGISRVVYGPRAARHVLRSRARRRACMADVFSPTDPGPDAAAPISEQHRVRVDECSTQSIGPFYVRAGGRLDVTVPDDLHVAFRPGETSCADGICTSAGPGPVWIDVSPRTAIGGSATLNVTYDRDEPWVPCMEGGFPDGAAVLKLDYRRVGFGVELAAYATDADALRGLEATSFEWTPTRIVDPGPERIFTLTLPSDARYRLAAMHIMTKELDHWVWTSLWWSDAPRTDFGADRPAQPGGLADGFEEWGVWGNYKMCVSTHFDAIHGEPTTFDDLDDALRVVSAAGSSWCSNPYLEEGPGNAKTNCVGCHQHAGTGLTPESILEHPDTGNRLERANFPTDYLWSDPLP